MAPAGSLPSGTVLGDFEIERPLSAGGMGAVYVAVQRSTGKRRALKVMRPELVADERNRRRFVEEARIGSRIDSAHVVEVVGAGVDEATGVPWLAMELLEGHDSPSTSSAEARSRSPSSSTSTTSSRTRSAGRTTSASSTAI